MAYIRPAKSRKPLKQRRVSFLGYIHKLRTVSKLLEDIGFSHTTKSKQLWKVKGVK